MELVLLAAVSVAAGVGGFVLGRRRWARRLVTPWPVARPAAQADRNRAARDAQSRAFQTALLRLAGTPDFRRAATVAAQAQLVPVEFRRRQFARFRPALIDHYRRCLTAGADGAMLHQSLTDLVTALGQEAFEADYVRAEAERALRQTTAARSPASRLEGLKREHEARLAAIRDGLPQEPDVQEQLIEAEANRFRDAVAALFDEPVRESGGVPTPNGGEP